MTVSATAVHNPDRARPGDTFSANVSLWLIARLAIVVEARVRKARMPVERAIATARRRVASASAKPAANPAGSHTTAIRRSGWEPRFASSSSGRAPDTDGPWASR